MGPARAGRRERVVIEARVAPMVAHSGAVVARGVAVMMGAEIAALAAVNHVCLRIAYMRVLVLRECVSCVVGSIQTLTC